MARTPITPGVYIRESLPAPPAIQGVATAITAFVGRCRRGPVERPTPIASFTAFEKTFGGQIPDVPLGGAVRDFFANGGSQALIVRLRRAGARGAGPPLSAAAYLGDAAARTGLHALARADLFNLLCVPPDRPDADIPDAVRERATALCAERNAFHIVDPPLSWTSAAIARAAAERRPPAPRRNTGHAALYFPRLVVRDPSRGNGLAAAAPCGAVAGVIARTDAQRGVWKAPAGTDAALRGIDGLDIALGDADQQPLNRLGINGLRTMPGRGTVVWGARTLAGRGVASGSDFTYVPVRRTMLYIAESISRGTRWAVFEANDEPLWARIRLAAGRFLDGLFRAGAFPGARPNDAYFVKCGRDTMTRADIANGRLVIEIGFAPLKPAEFVIIRIAQKTATQS